MVEIPPRQDKTELPISKIHNVNVMVEELYGNSVCNFNAVEGYMNAL